ncbi:MAG: serine dehydratase, partial [Clostridia bacterium]|nr:serine dehydratase [Clostridia bacterium]
MKSISAIYKIGKGPSSSHTMGPEKASTIFLAEHPEADTFRVTLYCSLSKTGRGHGTDTVIREVLGEQRTEIVWDNDTSELPHPNTMLLEALANGKTVARMRAMSIGGGDISIEGRPDITLPDIYRENHFSEIATICKSRNIRLCDYVLENEGSEILDYLGRVWRTMQDAISTGLSTSGTLPGGLNVERKAQYLFNQRHMDESA